ncbi:hypothetical protein [Clostridium botulinum]|uniref:Serine/threonine protein kinase n=2 Tax=Clostridium botulinum TaxID=1491 RepID=A0A9Q1ZB10_CLOBO|nr:hypothetical protein [Clostridium botulinum]AEB75591.1 serine/threonine kinase related protein [Clostridium botulinum BKT015925]KEH99550.1 serine/threonine protein kinase [Clostridium botulinum D str. 16868]KEI04319.1 serine/threonine protein kinase [Clostridium botulinum C/D str. Sp77]KLU75271.1 serine/threonine protein kinase [Clostridium botulinum V891]KOA76581.1 serine/threonine protein kinase [Clostridium botulinum]
MKNLIIAGVDIYKCKILHRSKTELIYLTPNNRVLKICKNVDNCRREYLILKYANNNKYFPKVFEYRVGYILREYVRGICIIDYIRKNNLSEDLALSLIDIIETFEKLGFIRLDTGLSHIFINKNGELKVIGLKNNCTRKEKYPKHMLNGLRRLKVSKKFFKILKAKRPDLYSKWK